MYKCSKGGLENSKGSKFCYNCGNKLNKETKSTGHTKKIVIIIAACVLTALLIAISSVMLINLYKRDLPVYATVGNTRIDSYTKVEDLFNNPEFEDKIYEGQPNAYHRDTGVSVEFFEDEGMIRIEDENDSGCIITPLGISSGMSVEQCFDALGKYSYYFDADCIRTKNESKK